MGEVNGGERCQLIGRYFRERVMAEVDPLQQTDVWQDRGVRAELVVGQVQCFQLNQAPYTVR